MFDPYALATKFLSYRRAALIPHTDVDELMSQDADYPREQNSKMHISSSLLSDPRVEPPPSYKHTWIFGTINQASSKVGVSAKNDQDLSAGSKSSKIFKKDNALFRGEQPFESEIEQLFSRTFPPYPNTVLHIGHSNEDNGFSTKRWLQFHQPTDKFVDFFQDPHKSRKLFECRVTDAQSLLDILQMLLDDKPDLSSSIREKLLIAMKNLSGQSHLYPQPLVLAGVNISNMAECSGSIGDLYKGDFGGHTIGVRVVKRYQQSKIDFLLKVVAKEAILWAQLAHPNLLSFYGLYRSVNRFGFVSPWMENGNVNDYLKRYPFISRASLVSGVAEGMVYLHSNGIVHGDLKGSNVLVDEAGRALLADFGYSSVMSQFPATSIGDQVRWQAPELFDFVGDVETCITNASDVYSFGCVVYEIFVGEIPFANLTSEMSVIREVSKGGRPEKPPKSSRSWTIWGLTEDIWSLMQACWHAQSEERPAGQMIIDQWFSSVGTEDTSRFPSEHVYTNTSRFNENASHPSLSPQEFRRKVYRKRMSSVTDQISLKALDNLQVVH